MSLLLPNAPAELPERKPLMPAAEMQDAKRASIRFMAASSRRTAEGLKALHTDVVAGLRTNSAAPQSATVKETPGYQVYTKEFDWVGNARELCSPAELVSYRRTLDRHMADHVGDSQRWAHRLQRYLPARRMSSWQFDLEEGLLDYARLTRVATNPTEL